MPESASAKRGKWRPPPVFIDGEYSLSPLPESPPQYRVGCDLPPNVVERWSTCGRIRLHLPDTLPRDETVVRLHCAPTALVPALDEDCPGDVILQGHVVVSARRSALLSHGGLLLQCTSTAYDVAPSTTVRTTVHVLS